MEIAVIIPTKDRPEDVTKILTSIEAQEIRPSQIIVVNGGSLPLDDIISNFQPLHITYIKNAPPSLPTQRNLGLESLKDDIDIVGFLDDDIILYPDTISAMARFLENASQKIGGVACNNISHPRYAAPFLERFFLLGSDEVGKVLHSGFQGKICSVNDDYRTEWLMGGATFWRREIFRQFKFDEWYYGYAHCEDLDFSYRVSKKFELYVIKDARVKHLTKPIERHYEYSLGKMQAVNRIYFVRKNAELSSLLCYWACLGLFLKNAFLGVLFFKTRYLSRAIGVMSGMLISLVTTVRIKDRIKP